MDIDNSRALIVSARIATVGQVDTVLELACGAFSFERNELEEIYGGQVGLPGEYHGLPTLKEVVEFMDRIAATTQFVIARRADVLRPLIQSGIMRNRPWIDFHFDLHCQADHPQPVQFIQEASSELTEVTSHRIAAALGPKKEVVAVVAPAEFDKAIKHGFVWESRSEHWWRTVLQAEVDNLPFRVLAR